MSLRDKETYENAFGTRSLTVREALTQPDGFTFTVDNLENGKREGATLTKENAVTVAKQILQRLEPDALAKPAFRDTPVGTFLQHTTGTIVKVVEWSDEVFGAYYSKGNNPDEVWSVTSDGKPYPAYQNPVSPGWKVVDVEEAVTTKWTVKA